MEGKLILRTDCKPNEYGEYPVIIQYCTLGKPVKKTTDVKVAPEHWLGGKGGLNKYIKGIEKWISHSDDSITPLLHIVTVERMANLAKAELSGTNKLLELLKQNQKGNE